MADYKPVTKKFGSEAIRKRQQDESTAIGTTMNETASPFESDSERREHLSYGKGGLVPGCKHHAHKVIKTGWHH